MQSMFDSKQKALGTKSLTDQIMTTTIIYNNLNRGERGRLLSFASYLLRPIMWWEAGICKRVIGLQRTQTRPALAECERVSVAVPNPHRLDSEETLFLNFQSVMHSRDRVLSVHICVTAQEAS